jgi:hypothetical protein
MASHINKKHKRDAEDQVCEYLIDLNAAILDPKNATKLDAADVKVMKTVIGEADAWLYDPKADNHMKTEWKTKITEVDTKTKPILAKIGVTVDLNKYFDQPTSPPPPPPPQKTPKKEREDPIKSVLAEADAVLRSTAPIEERSKQLNRLIRLAIEIGHWQRSGVIRSFRGGGAKDVDEYGWTPFKCDDPELVSLFQTVVLKDKK